MIRHAIDNGVRYIDTAYPYHGGESEIVIGKALKDGYREKVILTTKLPVWLVKTHEDMMKFLDEQLKKLDTPYVDFYILHAMNNERMDAMQKLDYKRFYAEAIAHGKVRYPGFSFHDDAKAFLRILHDWDQWGMCQVQMNILDDENQATLEGIREAGRRGVGVVVMEPPARRSSCESPGGCESSLRRVCRAAQSGRMGLPLPGTPCLKSSRFSAA